MHESLHRNIVIIWSQGATARGVENQRNKLLARTSGQTVLLLVASIFLFCFFLMLFQFLLILFF